MAERRLPKRGTPERRRFLARLRRGFWIIFGLVGLLDLELHWGLNIAKSIPVLFLISVYANYGADTSTEQGARTEVQAESANVGHADHVTVKD